MCSLTKSSWWNAGIWPTTVVITGRGTFLAYVHLPGRPYNLRNHWQYYYAHSISHVYFAFSITVQLKYQLWISVLSFSISDTDISLIISCKIRWFILEYFLLVLKVIRWYALYQNKTLVHMCTRKQRCQQTLPGARAMVSQSASTMQSPPCPNDQWK